MDTAILVEYAPTCERLRATMMRDCTRREILAAGFGVAATTCARPFVHGAPKDASNEGAIAASAIADIEATVGGRIGVFAVDTGNSGAGGPAIAHRDNERFAMCSTFKWVLAAAVLARVDRGELSLDERIAYGPGDLLQYAPITRSHVDERSMSIEALAHASVTVSDNTAANLLLAELGGPTALTRFTRALGDEVTRLERNEPALNENVPGDPRDTTSPRAMVGLMQHVLCGDVLSAVSRERLTGWLRACETGKRRLRAGFPRDWMVGDKTGSGARSAVNDVAIAHPPGRAPVVIATYMVDGHVGSAALDAAHADIARRIVRAYRVAWK